MISEMKVVVERGKTVPFDGLPPKSIALDGYVQGPAVDADLSRYSFDHHDGCLRMVTLATCQQVMTALHLGLDPMGHTIYVNDVDADTVLSVFLLENPDLVHDGFWQRVINVVGAVDSHGPAGLMPERGIGRVVSNQTILDAMFNYVMGPERVLRRDGSYQTCDLDKLLLECLNRLDNLVTGEAVWQGHGAEKDRQFIIVHSDFDNKMVMVESDDFVFDLLYNQGYTKVIAYHRLPDGSYAYTVGKKSDLVHWPLGPASKPGTVLHTLNGMEPGWGGGSSIGGAPRNPDGSRSRLTCDQVWDVALACAKG